MKTTRFFGKETLALFLASLCPLFMASADESPKELGYAFPDEWEERYGTMMIFPARHSYGRRTNGLRMEFAEIAKAIARNEPVVVFCYTPELEECRELLDNVPNLTVRSGDFRIDWARDTAPMLVRNRAGELAALGFGFNGWGKKYRGWQKDTAIRKNIAEEMRWKIFPSELVLEGGAIEIGNRVGIVTESCVLNPNRTNWPKERVEEELIEMLGLDRVIWIPQGLVPDPITDGHVDGLLKFVDENTVLLHMTDDLSDPNYRVCKTAKAILLDDGFDVIELPLADNMVHVNFYIGSGGDVAYVPVCGDPDQDEPALAVIRDLFDEVVPIMAKRLLAEGGGIHCYTQQIPK